MILCAQDLRTQYLKQIVKQTYGKDLKTIR